MRWEDMTLEQRTAHYADLNARRESMKHDPLLPCPFCGNPEPYRHTEHDRIEAGAFGPGSSAGTVVREYVNCGKCAARHQAPNPDASHWNMRPQPADQ